MRLKEYEEKNKGLEEEKIIGLEEEKIRIWNCRNKKGQDIQIEKTEDEVMRVKEKKIR